MAYTGGWALEPDGGFLVADVGQYAGPWPMSQPDTLNSSPGDTSGIRLVGRVPNSLNPASVYGWSAHDMTEAYLGASVLIPASKWPSGGPNTDYAWHNDTTFWAMFYKGSRHISMGYGLNFDFQTLLYWLNSRCLNFVFETSNDGVSFKEQHRVEWRADGAIDQSGSYYFSAGAYQVPYDAWVRKNFPQITIPKTKSSAPATKWTKAFDGGSFGYYGQGNPKFVYDAGVYSKKQWPLPAPPTPPADCGTLYYFCGTYGTDATPIDFADSAPRTSEYSSTQAGSWGTGNTDEVFSNHGAYPSTDYTWVDVGGKWALAYKGSSYIRAGGGLLLDVQHLWDWEDNNRTYRLEVYTSNDGGSTFTAVTTIRNTTTFGSTASQYRIPIDGKAYYVRVFDEGANLNNGNALPSTITPTTGGAGSWTFPSDWRNQYDSLSATLTSAASAGVSTVDLPFSTAVFGASGAQLGSPTQATLGYQFTGTWTSATVQLVSGGTAIGAAQTIPVSTSSQQPQINFTGTNLPTPAQVAAGISLRITLTHSGTSSGTFALDYARMVMTATTGPTATSQYQPIDPQWPAKVAGLTIGDNNGDIYYPPDGAHLYVVWKPTDTTGNTPPSVEPNTLVDPSLITGSAPPPPGGDPWVNWNPTTDGNKFYLRLEDLGPADLSALPASSDVSVRGPKPRLYSNTTQYSGYVEGSQYFGDSSLLYAFFGASELSPPSGAHVYAVWYPADTTIELPAQPSVTAASLVPADWFVPGTGSDISGGGTGGGGGGTVVVIEQPPVPPGRPNLPEIVATPNTTTGKIELRIHGRDSLLTQDQSYNRAGWITKANCSVTNNITVAPNTWSEMKATASGTMTAAVTAPYTAAGAHPWTAAATLMNMGTGSGRGVVRLEFLNGAAVVGTADSTFTAATPQRISVSATSPTNTTAVRMYVEVQGCAANDTWRFDLPVLRPGHGNEWSVGGQIGQATGLLATVREVTADRILRNGQNVPLVGNPQYAFLVDAEAPLGPQLTYSVIVTNSSLSVPTSSPGYGGPVSLSSGWIWISNPLDPTSGRAFGPQKFGPTSRPVRQGKFRPIGRADAIFTSGVRGLREGSFTLVTWTKAERDALQAFIDSGIVLLIRFPPDQGDTASEAVYARIDGDAPEDRPLPSRTTHRTLEVKWVEQINPQQGLTYNPNLAPRELAGDPGYLIYIGGWIPSTDPNYPNSLVYDAGQYQGYLPGGPGGPVLLPPPIDWTTPPGAGGVPPLPGWTWDPGANGGIGGWVPPPTWPPGGVTVVLQPPGGVPVPVGVITFPGPGVPPTWSPVPFPTNPWPPGSLPPEVMMYYTPQEPLSPTTVPPLGPTAIPLYAPTGPYDPTAAQNTMYKDAYWWPTNIVALGSDNAVIGHQWNLFLGNVLGFEQWWGDKAIPVKAGTTLSLADSNSFYGKDIQVLVVTDPFSIVNGTPPDVYYSSPTHAWLVNRYLSEVVHVTDSTVPPPTDAYTVPSDGKQYFIIVSDGGPILESDVPGVEIYDSAKHWMLGTNGSVQFYTHRLTATPTATPPDSDLINIANSVKSRIDKYFSDLQAVGVVQQSAYILDDWTWPGISDADRLLVSRLRGLLLSHTVPDLHQSQQILGDFIQQYTTSVDPWSFEPTYSAEKLMILIGAMQSTGTVFDTSLPGGLDITTQDNQWQVIGSSNLTIGNKVIPVTEYNTMADVATILVSLIQSVDPQQNANSIYLFDDWTWPMEAPDQLKASKDLLTVFQSQQGFLPQSNDWPSVKTWLQTWLQNNQKITNTSSPSTPPPPPSYNSDETRAANEILAAFNSGVTIAEDWTFRGCSAIVSTWNDDLVTKAVAAGVSPLSKTQSVAWLQNYISQHPVV